ncbi:SDR family NAD(P)-dependent oxidoreductase [Nonomuraea sp. NPDC003804]|uniref:type I polyketide synthase n=1 Tax=Nonomuraea sp. NPDC003804 TaxID=3154547 RepID=UPI0033AF883D
MSPTSTRGPETAERDPAGTDIAVVGIACRYPGARGPAEYWRLIRDGDRGIRELTREELAAGGAGRERIADPALVPAAGVLWDAERFDAVFFGYPAREAALIDPQQRMFLEEAWHAMEDAGHTPERFAGTVGVYAGQTLGTHRARNHQTFLGTSADLLMAADDKDFLPTRVSYKLGLTGPSIAVQTACSTSLVAIHLACRALITHDCDMALAGGVSWTPLRRQGYLHQEGGVWSADGQVRSFDRDASGFVPADGLGIVVLRRLDDALADGDRIYAVVKGSAVNNDGSDKLSYAAPGVRGQQAVVETALAVAAVRPDTVSYVEAHGTATAIGDAVEVAALTRAYRAAAAVGRGYCRVGSVKSNIGHTDAAAGVAGFIKVALMLYHGRIPPSPVTPLRPNPEIDFETSPFRPAVEAANWPETGAPRRAAVSAFGIGGTNAHAILEQPPALPARPPAEPWQLVALSARDDAALAELTRSCADALQDASDTEFADLAYTLAAGRRHFPHRYAGVFRDPSAAVAAPREWATAGRFSRAWATRDDVVFMFPGGGTQYPSMGRELYRDEPVFRMAVDECLGLLPDRPTAERLHALWAAPDARSAAEETDPSLALPAVFIMEIALTRLIGSFGVRPALLIGHSLGEYTAACVAGALSLRDALAIVAKRGELLSRLHDGAMLAVSAPVRQVEPFLGKEVCLSAVNGPGACVLAGRSARIADVGRSLDRQGIAWRLLPLSTAAHSHLVDPVLDEFRDFLNGIELHAPSVPVVSNVTGDDEADLSDPEYWVSHLRRTVRFDAGLDHVLARGPKVLIEVGPGTTLTTLAGTRAGRDSVVINTTRHPLDERPDREVLLRALARLWEAGVDVDLPALWPQPRRRHPAVPYPFASTLHLPEPAHAPEPAPALRSSEGLYGVTWKRAVETDPADPGPAPDETGWILFSDVSPLAEAITAELEERRASVTVVTPGREFRCGSSPRATTIPRHSEHYEIDPQRPEHYERLLQATEQGPDRPLRIISLWGATLPADVGGPLSEIVGLAHALGGRLGKTDLCLVTTGALEISGGELLDPRAALTIGAAGPLRCELTDVPVRLVDVEVDDSADHRRRARQILGEFSRPPRQDPVGLRAGHRWLRGFEALETPPGAGPSFRPGGTYVITGGTSGIGLRLAEHLARRHSARLALIGRGTRDASPAGESGVDVRALLAGRENDILLRHADVADPAALGEILREVQVRFGTIHGVIHAAGVPGGGMAQFLDRESIDAALRAKTVGTATLVSALAETGARPEFILLCSSLASFSGAPGLSCYGAANAFQDTFALHARRDGTPILSVNWDRWNGVGMARDVERHHHALTGESLTGGLSPDEGIAAFERCLAAVGLGQVIVSSSPPGAAHVPSPESVTEPRPARWSAPAVPAADTSGRSGDTGDWNPHELELLTVWQEVLGAGAIGRHDDFFSLGGHSLSALQVVQRCRERFGARLSVKALFSAPTIEGLARTLAEAPAAGDDTPGEGRLLMDLEGSDVP